MQAFGPNQQHLVAKKYFVGNEDDGPPGDFENEQSLQADLARLSVGAWFLKHFYAYASQRGVAVCAGKILWSS
jgi:hypothetical protein